MDNKEPKSKAGPPSSPRRHTAHEPDAATVRLYPSPESDEEQERESDDSAKQSREQGDDASSGKQEQEKDDKQEEGEKGDKKNEESGLPEWITFGVGLLIVVGTLLLMTYLHFTSESGPPEIQVSALTNQVPRRAAGYYLPVEVTNTGGETAEDVSVQLTLVPPEGSPESKTFAIRFLSPRETEKSTVIFQTDPTKGTIEYTVSFSNP